MGRCSCSAHSILPNMPHQEFPGQPLPRADGRDKVTGGATYAGDVAVPGMVHAVLV